MPGEDQAGVYSAKDFVGWYNGLPSCQKVSFRLREKMKVRFLIFSCVCAADSHGRRRYVSRLSICSIDLFHGSHIDMK